MRNVWRASKTLDLGAESRGPRLRVDRWRRDLGDISGNLPAAPATDLLILGDKLVVSTDVGVFVANAANPAVWSKLATGIPNAAVNALTLTPDGSTVVASTYGKGLWSIPTP